MSTTLLSCPFCGGAAHFEIDDARWEWVECESCGMQGNRSASVMDDCKPKLAEAWNRRAPAQVPLLSDELDRELVQVLKGAVNMGLISDESRSAIEAAVRAKLGVGWIACADQMPPPDARLLVAWGDGAVDKAHTFSKWKHPTNPLGYLIQGHPGSHNDVTHWMPLPPPPGIVGKEDA